MPGPGEVRVRLAFSGVNPSDVKSRAGVSSLAQIAEAHELVEQGAGAKVLIRL